jgi:RHS repeat-associated protein
MTYNHIAGEGNAYYTLFREYDPTLGRWWSADPLRAKYADMSPYLAFGANPISFTDVMGDSLFFYGQDAMLAYGLLEGWRMNSQNSNNNLKFDYIELESGMISITCNKIDASAELSPAETALFNSVNSPNIITIGIAQPDNYTSENALIDCGINIGVASAIGRETGVVEVGFGVNLNNSETLSANGFLEFNELIVHEVIESYLLGKAKSNSLTGGLSLASSTYQLGYWHDETLRIFT